MAVERHARLQAERIATSQPAWRHRVGTHDRGPYVVSTAVRDEDLEPILPGVSRAGDDHVVPGDGAAEEGVVLHLGQVADIRAGERGQDALRVGALDRD